MSGIGDEYDYADYRDLLSECDKEKYYKEGTQHFVYEPLLLALMRRVEDLTDRVEELGAIMSGRS